MAKKAKATHPVTAGMPRPSQNSSPNPRPDKVVKMMTEGAGCMSEFLQGLVQPADKALGLFGDGLEERGQHIDLAIGLWGGGSGTVHLVLGPRRQILVDRLRALLGHQVHAATLGHEFRNVAVRIAQIPEMTRP